MINNQKLFQLLVDNGINFFTGVPDSLLKSFCAYIADHTTSKNHIIAANEGGAVALAAGHYLATGKPALVYMQNAGEGNAVNPLLSLADPEVYGIPMLLLIGWRGEPIRQAQGKPRVIDEPQHIAQGKATIPLLEAMGIAYEVLPDSLEAVQKSLAKAMKFMKAKNAPYVLVVRKNIFEPYSLKKESELPKFELSREEAIGLVVDKMPATAVVVSTTGMASRELFEYREVKKQKHDKDFLVIGSMGHASQIALGIALAKPKRIVYCLDGDGSVIMHMGSLAIVGAQAPKNFMHVVLNNGVHDSVGGQPTVGLAVSFTDIAKACGYKQVLLAENKNQLVAAMKKVAFANGPIFLEIRVKKGARQNLGRPTMKPQKLKKEFMKNLQII